MQIGSIRGGSYFYTEPLRFVLRLRRVALGAYVDRCQLQGIKWRPLHFSAERFSDGVLWACIDVYRLRIWASVSPV